MSASTFRHATCGTVLNPETWDCPNCGKLYVPQANPVPWNVIETKGGTELLHSPALTASEAREDSRVRRVINDPQVEYVCKGEFGCDVWRLRQKNWFVFYDKEKNAYSVAKISPASRYA
jgi:hypothetical protein